MRDGRSRVHSVARGTLRRRAGTVGDHARDLDHTVLGFTLSYLRFAPKFSGREEKAPPLPPGARPAALTRQAAALRWTPPTAPAGGHATAPAQGGGGTATAVAERPAARPATAEASTEGAAAAADASARPTAGPSGEPAVQADAVGAAEAAAPEERPTAKTPEEVGAQAEAAPAQPVTPQPAPAAAAPAASHGGALDQETFDRVLAEQLAKGVDKRVAEGRARAAAVVAARKKGQG
jgi:hypothetical protein